MSARDLPDLPVTATNPPFLTRLRYRAAGESTVSDRVLQRLAEQLPQWNTARRDYREDPDAAVVFAELVGRTCELLGFYQDVRANEAFLRTATLESSLAELGALIDYRPAPGASAQTLQLFVVKPAMAGTIPAGYRIEAKHPKTGSTIVFETEVAILADASRNALPLYGYDRTSRRLNAPTAIAQTSLRLDRGYEGLKAGSVVVAAVDGNLLVVRLSAVTVDGNSRRIHWPGTGPGSIAAGVNLSLADLQLYGKPAQVMRLQGAVPAGELRAGITTAGVVDTKPFIEDRAAMIESGGFVTAVLVTRVANGRVWWSPPLPTTLRREGSWLHAGSEVGHLHGDALRGATTIFLQPKGRHAEMRPGDHLLLSDPLGAERLTIVKAGDFSSGGHGTVRGVFVIVAEPLSRRFRGTSSRPVEASWVSLEDRIARSSRRPFAPPMIPAGTTNLALDRAYEGLTSGSLVALDDGTRVHASRLQAAVPGEDGRTTLTLRAPLPVGFDIARMTIHGPFAHVMRADGWNRAEHFTVTGDSALVLAGHRPDVVSGMHVMIEGAGHAEGARVIEVDARTDRTTLRLARPLQHAYPVGTAFVSANVVPVSHGTTIAMQVLGSGDAAVPSQEFALPRTPLSHVQDAREAHGVRPALDVFVSDERWTRVDTLADSAPTDRHYIVVSDERGQSFVRFGDGVLGSRVPSGRDNVRVRYRVGMGPDGNLEVGRISNQPQALPFVSATRNAVASVGGAARETPADIRRSAPLAVRTLDRAVSLADYADLARSLTGIGKARADWERSAARRDVALTVVTTTGAPLTPDLAETLRSFLETRRAHGRLLIREGRPIPVRLALRVQLRDTALRSEATRRLIDAMGGDPDATGFFSLARRGLGESVFLSEVYAAVMAVEGVASAVATHFALESVLSSGAPADVIRLPRDAYATGGHPSLAGIGRLSLDVLGGVE